ncbi:MAG: GGDEF domain-containing protein [Pseudomonadota bacterium]
MSKITIQQEKTLDSEGMPEMEDSLKKGPALSLLEQAMSNLQELGDEVKNLEEKSTAIFRLSLHDDLTGMLNRKGYEQEISKIWHIFERYGAPFSLILIDIDNFKSINDTAGHRAGDKTLQKISGKIKKVFRTVDITARYGGDELAVILPNTGIESTTISAERLRKEVNKTNIKHQGKRLSLSISIGVATAKTGDSIATLFERADNALYRAKNSGKNQLQLEKTEPQ